MGKMSINHRKLKQYRLDLGLTLEQMAVRLGVDLRTLQNWEQGRHQPNDLNLNALKKVLPVSLFDVGPADAEESSPESLTA